jgi:predicted N-acetyltransferase YhbS
MRVKVLRADDVALVAEIDRSEHVDVQYAVVDGRLTEVPVAMVEIPPWDPTGSGEHSVAAHIRDCASVLDGGGVLLGAFDEEEVAGLAIVRATFEPELAWLASLHVSRPYRRRGAARALWGAAADFAVAAGARSMYVSATPTGSAVGFYLGQGCRLADPVHPDLFAAEPEDIHLICSLPRRQESGRL